VTPLPVDEDQRLIGREAAKRGRANVVAAVGDRRARKVERGSDGLNHLRRFRSSRLLKVGGGEHVDRNGGRNHRATFAARAENRDALESGRDALESKIL